tara:strand:- start:5071 stop:5241 length:171 start_codon:yes stop_codon:yes gene_type:complete
VHATSEGLAQLNAFGGQCEILRRPENRDVLGYDGFCQGEQGYEYDMEKTKAQKGFE